jgi:hypothetical protein
VNQPEPIMIDIVEPPESPVAGLADVLIGALGVTGVILVIAILVGAVLAGLMFWLRSGNPLSRS